MRVGLRRGREGGGVFAISLYMRGGSFPAFLPCDHPTVWQRVRH